MSVKSPRRLTFPYSLTVVALSEKDGISGAVHKDATLWSSALSIFGVYIAVD